MRMRAVCRHCGGKGYHEVITDVEDVFTRADAIVFEIAADYDLTVDVLKGPSRKTKHVQARAHAARLLRRLHFDDGKPLGLKEIGRLLGGRDHSTILHLLRKEV